MVMLTKVFILFQTASTLLRSGLNPGTQVHVTTSVLMMNLYMKSKPFILGVTFDV